MVEKTEDIDTKAIGNYIVNVIINSAFGIIAAKSVEII